MNNYTLGAIVGTGLLGLAKSKLSGSPAKTVDIKIYNGYALEFRFIINTKPILDETIFTDEVEWYFWFMTQPGFFKDDDGFRDSFYGFSRSIQKKYTQKTKSEDKWLNRWETLVPSINRDLFEKNIETFSSRNNFVRRREKEINGLSWMGNMTLTIRLPFLDGKTTSKDVAEMINNELLSISEVLVNNMNQRIIEAEKEYKVKAGVRFELDSISILPISTYMRNHYFEDENLSFQGCFFNPPKYEILFKEDEVYFLATGIVIQGRLYTADQIDQETLEFAPQKGPTEKKFGDIRKFYKSPKKPKLRLR